MSSRPTSTGLSSWRAPSAIDVVEPERARQLVRRHHLLHVADDEVDDRALEAEHVAERGDDDVLQLRPRRHLLQRDGEVLEDDDHFRAGVVELVLELAGGVERVDVDDDAAGAQRAEERDRVLQHVRHHDRDARALRETLRLEPRPEALRETIEIGEADRLAHVVVGGTLGELLHAGLDQRTDRFVFVVPDLRRHAGGIALQPDLLHGPLLVFERPSLAGRPSCGRAALPPGEPRGLSVNHRGSPSVGGPSPRPAGGPPPPGPPPNGGARGSPPRAGRSRSSSSAAGMPARARGRHSRAGARRTAPCALRDRARRACAGCGSSPPGRTRR